MLGAARRSVPSAFAASDADVEIAPAVVPDVFSFPGLGKKDAEDEDELNGNDAEVKGDAAALSVDDDVKALGGDAAESAAAANDAAAEFIAAAEAAEAAEAAADAAAAADASKSDSKKVAGKSKKVGTKPEAASDDEEVKGDGSVPSVDSKKVASKPEAASDDEEAKDDASKTSVDSKKADASEPAAASDDEEAKDSDGSKTSESKPAAVSDDKEDKEAGSKTSGDSKKAAPEPETVSDDFDDIGDADALKDQSTESPAAIAARRRRVAQRVAQRRAARNGGGSHPSDQAAYDDSYSYDDASYGDDASGGLMTLLRGMMAAQADTREEVHGPAPTLSSKNQELLTHLDRLPSLDGEREMGYFRYPNVHGDKVVFVSEGNIWVASVSGGPAARISASYSVEALPKISPDGKLVAFLAQSVDGYEVFVLPIAGGQATRVSYGSAAVKLEGWTREGKILVVTSFFSPTGLPQLATVDPKSKTMSVLPFARATGGTQDEHGCFVFYPLRQTSSTKRYEGGEQSRLWRWCEGDAEATILTPPEWTTRGSWNPVTTSAYPEKIFFISDVSGVANLWSMNTDGSEKTQLTHECGMDVMEVSLHGDVGVARVGGGLKRFRLTKKAKDPTFPLGLQKMGIEDDQMKDIPITLVSEFRDAAPQKLRFPLEELREIALSEDGMYAAMVIRGQIFFTPLVEQLGSRIEQVTGYDGAVRYRHVQFARSTHEEDNLKLIAMSDASGEYEYVLLERRAGGEMGGLWNETQLTSGGAIKGVMSYSTVSPDASSLVFDDTYGRISVLNLSTTAVNAFEFKTVPTEAPDEAAEAEQFEAMRQMMMGGGGDYEAAGAAAKAADEKEKQNGPGGGASPKPGQTRAAQAAKARERSKLRRKRREYRREARSQFRRDYRLGHQLASASASAPLSATPRAFTAGFDGKPSSTKPRARDMHNTRYGQAPLTGGFADLFGAHLGAAGPAPAGAAGTANVRTVMSGLRPEAAGDYSWSPDGKWLAFSAVDETEFSTVNVWNVETGEVQRLTHPSYNAVEPKFSPDGFFLYYFSDQQIESGADSPYGMRGSEPTIVGSQQLMCLPLRSGFKCPFFLGDEMNPQGQVFDPSVGQRYPTKINVDGIEKRAAAVPFLEKKQYADLHIVNGGATFVMQMWDGVGFYLIAMDITSGAIVPIYPDPLGVYVSGDDSVLMIAVEQGLALFSAQALAMPGITQDQLLASAVVWAPPEGWAVTVNPRAEWMQMYNDAMRNMRDAFYDPDMHGVDWTAVTEKYRDLVYKISTKSELRDVLQQALGELSVLHVFVSIRSEAPSLPVGEPSACLGGSLRRVAEGLEVTRVYDTSGVLAAPDSPLSAMAVDVRPGDVITRVDGVFVNASSAPLSHALLGKAGMQVLLEVDQKPRPKGDGDEQEILAQIQAAQQAGGMMGGAMGGGEYGADAGAMMSALMMGGMSGATDPSGHHRGHHRGHPATSFGVPTVKHRADRARLAALGNPKGGNGGGNHHPNANPNANPNAHPNAHPNHPNAPHPNGKSVATTKGGEANQASDAESEISGLKNVVVTPLSHEECSQLRAADALNGRRRHVTKRSNGELAYIYLEDMEQMGEGSSNSFDDFAAQFYPAIRKAGLIIDVRRNAGGNIDTWILERLRRVAWMFNTQRAGPGDTTMQYAFLGKVAVLVDEMTSSDAEIFAAGIQQLGLGKVIGQRSWGGAVGYSSNPELALVDGSGFTIPSFGPYVNNKWMIEQRGVVPDIVVENPPVATFNGGDAQLDAAVDHLMGLIKTDGDAAGREMIPAKPEYPDWSFDEATCAAGGDGSAKSRKQREGVMAEM